MRHSLSQLAEHAARLSSGDEIFLLSINGEASDFGRFNDNRIRQIGRVEQTRARFELIADERHAAAEFDISGQPQADRERLKPIVEELREQIRLLPPDPYLNYSTQPSNSERIELSNLPDVGEAVSCITRTFDGSDLAGIWAGGETWSGFANSLGQSNWHSVSSYNFDWSLHQNGQSTKRSFAGRAFDPEALARQAADARETLAVLQQSPRRLPPGSYRAFIAPEAVGEILSLIAWNGFGVESHRTRHTPFVRMLTNGTRLDPRVSIEEDNRHGFAPIFTQQGFIKPDRVTLIEQGRYAQCLVNARSASEFSLPVNAGSESPQSLSMSTGTLESDQILSRLDTGIYISNLWYCNYSDRNDCRITGMTRFACCWVENGRLVAPFEPMRFDDSLYQLLGDRLVDLTAESTLLLSADTYGQRSTASLRVPGILVSGITLTL